ncbi:MAG: response regulator [Candidatus Sumerlaeales bacterium]|nr:response regulator [Candidatus Sumerlaeales bacterium]
MTDKTWRILVVDDDEDIRLIIRASLEQDYDIVDANDGLTALELLDIAEPDFVILDIMMPMMNGYDLCKAIRKNERFSKLPVLFLSALAEKNDIIQGYEAGANLYLTKPFDSSRLQKNVNLFFQTDPPPRYPKRYTINEVKNIARNSDAIANARMSVSSKAPTQTSNNEQFTAISTTKSISSPRPRVLIIDDDSMFIELIKLWCDQLPIEYCFAVDGVDAIEKIPKYQPDLAFLDIMLPKMSGYQILKSLRANPRYAQLPVVVVTGKSSDKDKDYAIRVGATDYLSKPISQFDFSDVVKKIISAKSFRIYPKAIPIEAITAQDNVKVLDPFTTGKNEFNLPSQATSQFTQNEQDPKTNK